ncbi:hypothetical protein PENSPDRAFT_80364 [Peniophora sp. CONT]|nr:hypothetical protein PENSPDRAFT_80364 [Peniophora sp. CONT]
MPWAVEVSGACKERPVCKKGAPLQDFCSSLLELREGYMLGLECYTRNWVLLFSWLGLPACILNLPSYSSVLSTSLSFLTSPLNLTFMIMLLRPSSYIEHQPTP